MKDEPDYTIIKRCILEYVPGAGVKLFGSRANRTYDKLSDYDILLTVPGTLDTTEKARLKKQIRKELALYGIAVDLVVTSELEINVFQNITNHIVNIANQTGINL